MDKPLILNPSIGGDNHKLKQLQSLGATVIDHFESQSKELHVVLKPNQRHNQKAYDLFLKHRSTNQGTWIYYSWNNTLIHILDKAEFRLLRTARNNPLFTTREQKMMSKLTIGVAGLSVGSNIVRSLVYAGIGSYFKIADPDYLETSNLNRITGNLLDVGLNKTEIMARQIWEIDPYLEIELYQSGLNFQNIAKFLKGKRKLSILFDEVDDLSLKFHLRLAARSSKIIYAMVTDNGFSAELDVSRFDLSQSEGGMSELPSFALTDVLLALKNSEKIDLTPTQEQKLINTLLGPESSSTEMALAGKLKLSGKIAGWPQLQAVASVGSSMAVFAIRQLVRGNLKSGKKVISLNG